MNASEALQKLIKDNASLRELEKSKQDESNRKELAKFEAELVLCRKVAQSAQVENHLQAININWLKSQGLLEKLDGIFEFKTLVDPGSDYNSSTIDIKRPAFSYCLHWENDSRQYGIFLGFKHDPYKEIKNMQRNVLAFVTNQIILSGPEAASFLHESDNPNLRSATKGPDQLYNEFGIVIANYIFTHIHCGNLTDFGLFPEK